MVAKDSSEAEPPPQGVPERRRGDRRSRREAAAASPPVDRRGFDRRRANRPPLLTGFSVFEMDALLSYFSPLECAEGTLLVHEGAPDSSLYLIRSGTFEVLVSAAAGEAQSAGFLRKGDVFGELSFFDHEPRSADIRAVEPSEVMVLTPSSFEMLRNSDPQLAIELLLRLAEVTTRRFRAHNRKLAAIGMITTELPW